MVNLNDFLIAGQAKLLALVPAPTPTGNPAPTGDVIDTDGAIAWMASTILPFGCAILGLVFLFRAKNGQVSQTLTSTGVAMIGLVFFGAAAILPFLGDDLVNIILK